MPFIPEKDIRTPQSPANSSSSFRPEPKKQSGLLGSIVKGLARPIIKEAASIYAPIAATGSLLKSLPGGVSPEEKMNVESQLVKPRSFGFLGEVRPVGVDQTTGEDLPTGRAILDILGTGAELATYAVGGPEIGTTGKAVISGAVRPMSKEGMIQAYQLGKRLAPVGFTQGVGAQIQEDDAAMSEIITSGLIGGGSAFGLGILTPAASAVLSKGFRGLTGALNEAAPKAAESAQKTGLGEMAVESVGRGMEKIGTKIESVAKSVEAKSLMSPEARTATASGIDESVIKMLENASDGDFKAYQEMFETALTKMEDPTSQVIPRNVHSKTFLNRVGYLVDDFKATGKQLGEIKKNLPEYPIDVTPVRNQFADLLTTRGLTLSEGKVTMGSQARVAEGDLPFYNKIADFLSRDKHSPVDIDAFRERLFAEYKSTMLGQTPFTSKVKSDLSSIRSSMMNSVDNVSNGYSDLSKTWAVNKEALTEFAKSVGFKKPIEEITTSELMTAQVLRRLVSNAPAKVQQSVDKIEALARSRGFSSDDNVYNQVLFDAMLQRVFPNTQLNSLAGQVESGTSASLREAGGALGDAARGNILGLGSRFFWYVLGKGEQDQINALKKLLDIEDIVPKN